MSAEKSRSSLAGDQLDNQCQAGTQQRDVQANTSSSASGVPRAVLEETVPQPPISGTLPPRYTHRRSSTAPPWQEGQQWGPKPTDTVHLSAARRNGKSPAGGHQRSSTLPTITLTQPPDPPAERIDFPPRNLLAVRLKPILSQDSAMPPEQTEVPLQRAATPAQEAVASRRVSNVGLLRNAAKRAEDRKRRREEGYAIEHLAKRAEDRKRRREEGYAIEHLAK